MANARINHVIHGLFQRRTSQLSPEEVGRFYDNFVIACVDIVPIINEPSGRKILLGLRHEEPKTWWTIGRGMVPGESPYETASRALSEEFGITGTGHDRFKLLCINSSVFSHRRQPPEQNGRHCLTIVFALEVKELEIERLVSKKYKEVAWFDVQESSVLDPTIRMVALAVQDI